VPKADRVPVLDYTASTLARVGIVPPPDRMPERVPVFGLRNRSRELVIRNIQKLFAQQGRCSIMVIAVEDGRPAQSARRTRLRSKAASAGEPMSNDKGPDAPMPMACGIRNLPRSVGSGVGSLTSRTSLAARSAGTPTTKPQAPEKHQSRRSESWKTPGVPLLPGPGELNRPGEKVKPN
jgi:hypothetical protein